MDKAVLAEIITKIIIEELKSNNPLVEGKEKQQLKQEDKRIPVGVSNRHVHLSPEHIEVLFGPGAQLTHFKDLSQPGQYACQETVTVVGPKGAIEKVRVLGPARKFSQVEIAVSDCFKLGTKPPIRDSGDLKNSAGITLVGPRGSITIPEGCIIANRHIHMHTFEANKFSLRDGQRVSVRANGPRSVTFAEVLIRVSDNYKLEIHLDMDEANAVGIRNGDSVELLL